MTTTPDVLLAWNQAAAGQPADPTVPLYASVYEILEAFPGINTENGYLTADGDADRYEGDPAAIRGLADDIDHTVSHDYYPYAAMRDADAEAAQMLRELADHLDQIGGAA